MSTLIFEKNDRIKKSWKEGNKLLKTIFDGEKREKIDCLVELLFEEAYSKLDTLSCVAYVSKEPLKFEQRFQGRKTSLTIGDTWAEDAFDCAWMHITGNKPKGYENKELAFLLDCGGEGLIYGGNGTIKQAITCYASDFEEQLGLPVKKVVLVDDDLYLNNKIDFWIDCGANDLFGKMKEESRIHNLFVAKINGEIRELAYDLQVLLTVVDSSDDEDFRNEIIKEMKKIEFTDKIDCNLVSEIRRKIEPLMNRKNSEEVFTYSAIGHGHLDLAWLWPIRESIRKGARTFATQIKNIEKYSEYVFGASQAQLYQWIKDSYPQLYRKIKILAKTSNWDLQGATWVEMDSNLIGAESMIRQFYYGKKFFRQEFCEDMKIFWVPDSFGYSACIPQIMKLANVPYFLTQKMSWNTINKFPFHSFYWEGLDGTKVLSHMLPESTYNSPMRGDFLKKGESNYTERDISKSALILYGIGDGGAGPGYEHIERAKRYQNLKGMPKVKMEKSRDFFEKFDNGVINYPTYQGELYLEKHQGTYTTQSKNKKYNRKCEFALRNYEMLIPLAEEHNIELPINMEQLENIWKEILLYQFHDILPGSSINRVYTESVERYEFIYCELTNAIDFILGYLFPKNSVINFNAFDYEKKLKIDESWYHIKIPALGSIVVNKKDKINDFKAVCGFDYIENDKIIVSFEKGYISSLYDKQLNKEFVMEGRQMAVLSKYTDEGDCWDIAPVAYQQTRQDARCTSFRTGVDGPKAYAICEYMVEESVFIQEFFLLDGENMVYVDLEIDWHQKDSMLRVSFPVNINANECNFNLAYGHLPRKTTESNSVELAQFEVSGHKFIDMSENSYGISLINDSKYGYRCKHGIMDLNLVRSPKHGPGTDVDQGKQTIHYALLTHPDKLGVDTYKQAYYINNPFIMAGNNFDEANSHSFYTTTNETIILETVKIPEDNNGIIVRYYNCSNKIQSANIAIHNYNSIEVVDIMEDRVSDIEDNKITLDAFELINIRYKRRNK